MFSLWILKSFTSPRYFIILICTPEKNKAARWLGGRGNNNALALSCPKENCKAAIGELFSCTPAACLVHLWWTTSLVSNVSSNVIFLNLLLCQHQNIPSKNVLHLRFLFSLMICTIHISLSPCNASSNGAIFFTEAFAGNGTKFGNVLWNDFWIV